MTDRATISWTDSTWNPVTGCTKVSPGCDNCYAEGIARRFAGGKAFPRGFEITERPHRLDDPLRWREPRRIFVNSMSDLFHGDVPSGYIASVFAVMALAPQHQFQVLTKRPGRMRSLLNSEEFRALIAHLVFRRRIDAGEVDAHQDCDEPGWWPLRNVWLGVSVEDDHWAKVRIPVLLDTPAALRFLSCEPLLGPVTLHRDWLVPSANLCGYSGTTTETHAALAAVLRAAVAEAARRSGDAPPPFIDWVIVGGESGPGARPMHPEWARSLRARCRAFGIPFHFKQWGTFAPRCRLALGDGTTTVSCSCDGANASHPIEMRRVGVRAAGRLLDGQVYDEFPEPRR